MGSSRGLQNGPHPRPPIKKKLVESYRLPGGQNGVRGIHGNQNPLNTQTVVAVFLDNLIML